MSIDNLVDELASALKDRQRMTSCSSRLSDLAVKAISEGRDTILGGSRGASDGAVSYNMNRKDDIQGQLARLKQSYSLPMLVAAE